LISWVELIGAVLIRVSWLLAFFVKLEGALAVFGDGDFEIE